MSNYNSLSSVLSDIPYTKILVSNAFLSLTHNLIYCRAAINTLPVMNLFRVAYPPVNRDTQRRQSQTKIRPVFNFRPVNRHLLKTFTAIAGAFLEPRKTHRNNSSNIQTIDTCTKCWYSQLIGHIRKYLLSDYHVWLFTRLIISLRV